MAKHWRQLAQPAFATQTLRHRRVTSREYSVKKCDALDLKITKTLISFVCSFISGDVTSMLPAIGKAGLLALTLG